MKKSLFLVFILSSITVFGLGGCSKNKKAVPAVEVDPIASGIEMAQTLVQEGDPVNGIKTLEELNQRYPNQAEILEALAFAHTNQNNHLEAAFYFESIAKLDSAQANLFLQAAQSYEEEKEYDSAMRCYNLYLEAHPANGKAWKDYAKVLVKKQEFDHALEAYIRALSAENGKPTPFEVISIGKLYFKKGDLAQANDWYELGKTTAESRPYALLGQAEIRIKQNNLAETESLLNTLTQEYPSFKNQAAYTHLFKKFQEAKAKQEQRIAIKAQAAEKARIAAEEIRIAAEIKAAEEARAAAKAREREIIETADDVLDPETGQAAEYEQIAISGVFDAQPEVQSSIPYTAETPATETLATTTQSEAQPQPSAPSQPKVTATSTFVVNNEDNSPNKDTKEPEALPQSKQPSANTVTPATTETKPAHTASTVSSSATTRTITSVQPTQSVSAQSTIAQPVSTLSTSQADATAQRNSGIQVNTTPVVNTTNTTHSAAVIRATSSTKPTAPVNAIAQDIAASQTNAGTQNSISTPQVATQVSSVSKINAASTARQTSTSVTAPTPTVNAATLNTPATTTTSTKTITATQPSAATQQPISTTQISSFAKINATANKRQTKASISTSTPTVNAATLNTPTASTTTSKTPAANATINTVKAREAAPSVNTIPSVNTVKPTATTITAANVANLTTTTPAKQPSSVNTLQTAANAAPQNNVMDDAINACWKAVEAQPKSEKNWLSLSDAYSRKNDIVHAQSTALEALRVNPNSDVAATHYINVLNKNTNRSEYFVEINKLKQQFPHSASVATEIAHSYEEKLNNPRNAYYTYLQFLEKNPNHPQKAKIEAESKRLYLKLNPANLIQTSAKTPMPSSASMRTNNVIKR